jgi:hypothetical protein
VVLDISLAYPLVVKELALMLEPAEAREKQSEL